MFGTLTTVASHPLIAQTFTKVILPGIGTSAGGSTPELNDWCEGWRCSPLAGLEGEGTTEGVPGVRGVEGIGGFPSLYSAS